MPNDDTWNITNGDEVLQGKPLDADDPDPHLFQWVPPTYTNDLDEALTDLRDGGYRWQIQRGDTPQTWRIQHKREPISHDISSRDLQLRGYNVYYNDDYLPRAPSDKEFHPHYHLHDTTDPTKGPGRIWATQRVDDLEDWQEPEPGALNEPWLKERSPDLWTKHWGAADPPDWRDRYNYRERESVAKSCASCSAWKPGPDAEGNGRGRCEMFDAPVKADMTCDEWSDTWKKTAGDILDYGNEWIGNLSFLISPRGDQVLMGQPGEHHTDVWSRVTGEELDAMGNVVRTDSEYFQWHQGNIGVAIDKDSHQITLEEQDANGNEEVLQEAEAAAQQWLGDGRPMYYTGGVDAASDTWFNKESNDDQAWQEDEGAGAEAQGAAGASAGQVEYNWPSPEEAQELSYHAVDNHQGFRDPGGFASAVTNARYQQIYGGITDPYALAAHLINYIQRQQALVEGNKRTATLTGLWFLEENGVDTEGLPPGEFGDLVVSMAEKTVTPEQVGEYLRAHLEHHTAHIDIALRPPIDPLSFECVAKFILKSDWNDVMSKAKRLIQEGKVTIVNNTPQHVMARVIGDGSDNDGTPDMHEVEFSRDDPNSNVITQSVCDCAYNQYRWDRTRPWKKFEGRPCSHILAAYWKSKSTPQDIEDAAPGYQVPVGQKGPAAPQGQMQIPNAMPGVTKKDLGFGEGAFGPEGQEGAQVPPPVPSTQQLGIPQQPQNPFNPPKSTGPRPTGPPQREQLQLFDISPEPSTQPPNPAVSVPGATPPTPDNPVQLPGTFSRVGGAQYDALAPGQTIEIEHNEGEGETGILIGAVVQEQDRDGNWIVLDADGREIMLLPNGKAMVYDGWSQLWELVGYWEIEGFRTSRAAVRLAAAEDEMLQHFIAQQGNGDPIYVATTKPQTLEYRGGKHPMPGAQPYDVSSEGVPLYKMLELGYNPETGRREDANPTGISGAPEWRGQYGEVPMNRRGEVRDFDPHLGWAYVHVPLHYPGGEDARLHPMGMSGWVPMSELRVVHPPRSPFRRR